MPEEEAEERRAKTNAKAITAALMFGAAVAMFVR